MKKAIIAFIAALLAFPALALATQTSWDYTSGVLQPSLGQRAAEVKVPYITATSTASSTLPKLEVPTSILIGPDYITDFGNGFAISGAGVVTVTLGTTISAAELANEDFGAFTVSGGVASIDANTIGDTELTFDTGQHLTTTSAPTFASTTLSNLTSAMLLTDSSGVLAEYAGTSCTNQFVRSLSALGVATCATVGTLDVSGLDISDDTNLAGDTEIVLTDDTLSIASTIARDTELHSAVTLSGALDYITLVGQDIVRGAIDLATDVTGVLGIANGGLGAAFTDPNADRLMFWDDSLPGITGIATLAGAAISGTTLTINDVTCTDCLTTTEIADSYLLNNGDAGTGVFDFGGATSLETVNGTGPTVDAAGEFAIDTTSGQFKWFGGVSGTHVLTGTTSPALMIASTTQDGAGRTFNVGTTSILIKNDPEAFSLAGWYCQASSTGVALVRFGDGTNWTNAGTCATTGARFNATSNNTFTAFEPFYVQIGSTSTIPNNVTITTVINKTAD